MPKSFEKYQKKRLRSSYLSVVVSIALVLFLLGLLGFIVLKTKALAQHFKEQIQFSVFLNTNTNIEEVAAFQKELANAEFTKSIEYISKDEAAKVMEKEIGQDFLNFLGTNPLKDAININLKSDFVSAEKMDEIKKSLVKNNLVHEVSYDRPLIELLNNNIKKISFWILLFTGFLTLIAMVLINNSIRLSVYSKRFTIKTMQMVGATKRFIRRPFVLSSIKLGVLGSVVAMIGLLGLSFYIEHQIPEIRVVDNIALLGIVFGGILLLGVLISWVSTSFATKRFLNLNTNELYY